jgi:hypothetical protein
VDALYMTDIDQDIIENNYTKDPRRKAIIG